MYTVLDSVRFCGDIGGIVGCVSFRGIRMLRSSVRRGGGVDWTLGVEVDVGFGCFPIWVTYLFGGAYLRLIYDAYK